jgi:hypothetical protein
MPKQCDIDSTDYDLRLADSGLEELSEDNLSVKEAVEVLKEEKGENE